MKNRISQGFFTSVIWSIGQRYLPSLIQIISMLIITRMISPSDFGEVAIVTTITQIAMLFVSSGLSEGLIFKGDSSQIRFTSVFYFNVGIAVLIYILFYFISVWLAEFYSISRLELLTRIISINLIIYSLSYIQRTIYQMKLLFKQLMLISLVSTILACSIGLYLAYSGAGVWSIVFLTLLVNIFESIALWVFSSWRPSFRFSLSELVEILPYSLKLLLNNIIQALFDNAYSLAIGKYLGSQNLGYFNRMQTVVYYTTTNFMYSIESVFFPILCKDNKSSSKLKDAYEKLLRICTMSSSFILLIFIVVPQQIITVILTEKWIDGAPILRLLSIAFLFVPISYINNSFLKIINQPSILLYGNIIKKVVGVLFLIISLTTRDIFEICYSFVAYYLIDAIISMINVHWKFGISILSQLFYLKNSFVCLLLGYWVAMFVKCHLDFNNDIICIMTVVTCLIVVFVVINLLFRTKELLVVRNIFYKPQIS